MSPYLGLDYGLSRIGIAVSDSTDTLAIALHTHQRSEGSFFTYLTQIVHERQIQGVVVGLPLKTSGEEGELAVRAREFARMVAQHTGLPVFLEDERFTSQEARAQLRLSGQRGRPKSEVDAVAAEIILQQFLDRKLRSGNEGIPPR